MLISTLDNLPFIREDPYPPEDASPNDDENLPSIKKLTRNVSLKNFFRWGITGGITGNHRIIFAIHNYHKVVLLHYFDKQYNGDIQSKDIIPAERAYNDYCADDPLY